MKTLRWIVPLVLALAALLPAGTANSQEFPSRLVKLIVPYPPGGGVDGLARPIAERLGRRGANPSSSRTSRAPPP
jgi:tripartite-type tricarboxylate transporter receptor subunit TctC